MGWALWLAAPVATTALVAVWTWLRGRPARRYEIGRTADSDAGMREHQAYLDALTVPARGTARVTRD